MPKSPAMPIPDATDLITWCRSERERFLADLTAWIAIPSISADPAKKPDVARCGQTIIDRMLAIGMTRAMLVPTVGNPVAYGEWLGAPGKPTVLIYGHYDVQPVDPLELWKSPPFSAHVRDGKLYGRGAVDDKGQVLMHLAAIEAHLRINRSLPLNIKVVVEGEEEIGSPNFESFLAANRELLACDIAVISDTAVFSEDVPSLTVSLRGLTALEVTVEGPTSDLHSGYYGGVVRNPIEALCAMLAQLKDANGHVVVDGFYDGVAELSASIRAEIRALPYDEAREAQALGVPALAGEAGFTPLERMWHRPTLEINGIWGGYQGPGSKTIIPSWAKAKLTMRLVGDQDPVKVGEAVGEYLRKHAPTGVRVTLSSGHGAVRAVSTSRDHPAVQAAAAAMERGFGKPPVFIGTGGSIGPVGNFDRILHLPQVLIGVGLPDDAIHAPNEKFDLAQFYGGIETMVYLYDELAARLDPA